MTADLGVLFINELLKLRRSLATLMLVLAPISVVLLVVLLHLANQGGSSEDRWLRLAQTAVAVWAYLVFPLLVALQAAVINGLEHRVDGWKRMFALPIHPGRFFLAKLLALIVMMGFASMLLAVGFYAVTAVAHAGFASWPAIPDGGFTFLVRSMSACVVGGMFIMVIHHVLSWTLPSFVFPLGLSIVAVMAVFMVGASEYWVFLPWCWSLLATAGSDPAIGDSAMMLGVTLALIAAPLAALGARRLRRLGQ